MQSGEEFSHTLRIRIQETHWKMHNTLWKVRELKVMRKSGWGSVKKIWKRMQVRKKNPCGDLARAWVLSQTGRRYRWSGSRTFQSMPRLVSRGPENELFRNIAVTCFVLRILQAFNLIRSITANTLTIQDKNRPIVVLPWVSN